MSSGRIEVIIGCMFSGKSSEIIRLIHRYSTINKKLLILNHALDKRYGDSVISSHDKVQVGCKQVSSLNPLIKTKDYTECEVIIIEEGQFFKDLFEFVTLSADKYNKIVIVSGLDGDYKRQPFGDILRLIPHAEVVKKLSALCVVCNNGMEANFTKRLVDSEELELIGTTEYRPTCRYHYLNSE